MQYLFASHLPLPPASPEGEASEQIVLAMLSRWVGERFAVHVTDWTTGQTDLADGGQARWSRRHGEHSSLVELIVEHPDTSDARWRWRSAAWLGSEDGDVWLRSRVGLAATIEGLVAEPNISVGRPRFVRDVVSALHPTLDGREVGSWDRISSDGVPHYTSFLTDPQRRLPVVAVTAKRGASSFIKPDRLADSLLGLAHVVGVLPEATYAVSAAVTPTRSAFGGAIRLYWPGFTAEADPYAHPLWMPPTLQRLGPDVFLDQLVARVGRIATISIGVPPLEARLRKEASRREITRRRAETSRQIEDLKAEATEARTAGVDQETWDAFTREFEQLEQRTNQLEEQNRELPIQLDEEREDRSRAEEQARVAWRALGETARADGPSPIEGMPEETACSVDHAVHIAKARTAHLVFLPEAHTTAARSEYTKYGQVLDDLLTLADVARAWKNDALAGDFRTAFTARTSAYRSDIRDGPQPVPRGLPAGIQRRHHHARSAFRPRCRFSLGDPAHLLVRGSGRACLRHRPRRPQAQG
jgi:hypothetical protein